MSDDFIPLNQSTPVQQKWQQKNIHHGFNNRNHNQNGPRRGRRNNNWGNNSSRSSYGSNSSNNSYGQDSRSNIDAYLHPSMLQDPWESLRQKKQENNT